MVTIDVSQRRARLARRHALAQPVRTVEEACASVFGLHSSDPASVHLSARARVEGYRVADLDDALYERRSLVRMLGMRRTMFVIPTEVASTMDAACTKALAPGQRTRLVGYIEEAGISRSGGRWLRTVEARTLAALREAGPSTAVELTKLVPELGLKLTLGEGKTWGGTVGMSTRVLFLLATDGHIVRGRPLGGWTSSQYRWAATDEWLGAPLDELPAPEARADLVRRWLTAFGPGTEVDIKWWTGWTVKQARAALAAVDAVAVDLADAGGRPGYVLPDDLDPVEPPDPWIALLPGLDPTIMGWKERDWYLGAHAGPLFDRNGNAGPTVWVDGRAVGAWAQRADGSVAVELLEAVPARTRKRIDAEAARVAEWCDGVKVTVRFSNPLVKELAAS